MNRIIILKCELCSTLNGFWVTQCRGCGLSRSRMDWIDATIKAAEERYQEILKQPSDQC